jgi:hypothetical protein
MVGQFKLATQPLQCILQSSGSYKRTTEINGFGVSEQTVVLFWVKLPSRLQQMREEITDAVENFTKTLAAMMENFKIFFCTRVGNYVFTSCSFVINRTLMKLTL